MAINMFTSKMATITMKTIKQNYVSRGKRSVLKRVKIHTHPHTRTYTIHIHIFTLTHMHAHVVLHYTIIRDDSLNSFVTKLIFYVHLKKKKLFYRYKQWRIKPLWTIMHNIYISTYILYTHSLYP